MALPPVLIPLAWKAIKVARDPRTIEAAKVAYKTGSDILEKRKAKTVLPKQERSETKIQKMLARRKMFRKGAAGERIRFEITDPDGIMMIREVTHWHSTGKLLIGHCINRKAEREFPISRITRYEDSE